jgi:hypothetical protein
MFDDSVFRVHQRKEEKHAAPRLRGGNKNLMGLFRQNFFQARIDLDKDKIRKLPGLHLLPDNRWEFKAKGHCLPIHLGVVFCIVRGHMLQPLIPAHAGHLCERIGNLECLSAFVGFNGFLL